MNFSLNPRGKDLHHFREETSRCLEFWIKQVSRVLSLHLLPLEKNRKFSVSTKRNKPFLFSCRYQATPGFELGKKDLQSPALPLGHIAKMIQKKYIQNTPPLKNGVLNLFTSLFYVFVSLIPFYLIPLFYWKNKRINFSHKRKVKISVQIAIVNY